jgi:hypothetical protein
MAAFAMVLGRTGALCGVTAPPPVTWPGWRKMVIWGAACAAGSLSVDVGASVLIGAASTGMAGSAPETSGNCWLMTGGAGSDTAAECLSSEARLCAPIMVARVPPVTSDSRTANRFVEVSFAGGIRFAFLKISGWEYNRVHTCTDWKVVEKFRNRGSTLVSPAWPVRRAGEDREIRPTQDASSVLRPG